MNTGTLLFDPLIPWSAIAVLAVLSSGVLILALWRGLSGWALRFVALIVILGILTGPAYQTEERDPLSDIVLLVQDESSSQNLSDRAEQSREGTEILIEALEARSNTEIKHVRVSDAPGDGGTELMAGLTEALAEEPRGRIAGIIVLSDGQIHDPERMPDLPAPLHLLRSGKAADWDRRLIVRNAPSFAIIGEEFTLTLKVEDQGAAPENITTVPIDIAVGGTAPQRFSMPVGQDVELPLTVPHGGRNVIQFSVPAMEGELTDRNNSALVQINGVRDRLRVLLVSGEPHAGGRTWRNLLKSDSSVDLVHFTILRPPEKQDGVPVEELSLIAFPTRELFLEKIHDFDLIIFDRYKRRGILPSVYLANVAEYVEQGGAVLIAAGPDFASADSIYRSPLSSVLPARPTARVIEERFRPEITEQGARHPVTADLGTPKNWGSWLRQIEIEEPAGHVVMTGIDQSPLLVLNRVGQGRVALLGSDQAWLWTRGYEGGGPQLDLLRRLAHWMMKEPELEEEALWAEVTGQRMRIIRRTLGEDIGSVQIRRPDGNTVEMELEEVSPGRFEGFYDGPMIGLYQLVQDDQTAVIGLGPAAPREFVQTIATDAVLAPAIAALRGGSFALEDGVPILRNVRIGRPAAGRGWIGLTPRGAYETRNIQQTDLLPPWLALLLASAFLLLGWLREGRS